MSMTVNKADDGIVKRMTLAGATTGTLVALHKTGKLNTQAADAFIKKVGTAIKSGDIATLKESGKTLLDGAKRIGEKILNTGKDFMAKDGAAKKEILSGKAKSLLEGAKTAAKKALETGKEFWAKDAAGKKAAVEKLLKNPSTKYIAGITAAFVALGLILKAIKNHKSNA